MNSLKKAPVFVGTFAKPCIEFLEYKRALGYKYESEAKIMSRFCRFCNEFYPLETSLSKELVVAWTAKREDEAKKSRQLKISCIRQLSVYLSEINIDCYMVPPQKFVNDYSFVPYIFTKKQILCILKAADRVIPRRVSQNMHLILPVLFKMLYTTGLRISEALKLQVSDVDLQNGVLLIRSAKFDKDRYVPMDQTLTIECRKYAALVLKDSLPDSFYFSAPNGTMLSPLTIYNRFRNILWECGISHGGKGKGPRLHDLRHTFAVHTLAKWVLAGKDINALLPVLSAYLGHSSIHATSRYLRLTADMYPSILDMVEKTGGYAILEVSL